MRPEAAGRCRSTEVQKYRSTEVQKYRSTEVQKYRSAIAVFRKGNCVNPGNTKAKQAAIIREGIAAGTLNPALDPESTANAIWVMLNGLLSLALRQDELRPASVTPEALVASALTLVEFGLRRRD